MTVLAPVAMAIDSVAASTSSGCCRRDRSVYRRSCARFCTTATRRVSRHCSSTSDTGPNARMAAARASAGFMPAAVYSSTCSSRWRRISARSSASASTPRNTDRKRIRARSIQRGIVVSPSSIARGPHIFQLRRAPPPTLAAAPIRAPRRLTALTRSRSALLRLSPPDEGCPAEARMREGGHRLALAAGALVDFADHETDRVRQTLPAFELARELLAAGSGKRVELRFAAGLRDAGLRPQPSLLLEPMKRGIERPLGDLQRVLADLLDPLRDGPPVFGFEGHGFEDEEIERPLDQIGRPAHGAIPKLSTTDA